MIANIPFDFFVKSQKLPAGVYEITSLNPTAGQTALLFGKKDTTANGAIVTLFPMNIERDNVKSSLVLTFNRYGSTYFLSEVRNGNGTQNFGGQAPKTKQERNLAKQMGETKRESVALSNQR